MWKQAVSCPTGRTTTDLYRRAAVYVDKILKGAKPADLPVQQATKFEFVINLESGKTNRSDNSRPRAGAGESSDSVNVSASGVECGRRANTMNRKIIFRIDIYALCSLRFARSPTRSSRRKFLG